MNLRSTWLATTALVGAAVFSADMASAATVAPGGALDLTITGFARFRAHGGDIDNARLDGRFSRDLDFSNDTEVHVVGRGRDATTGLEYGMTVEFEADTNVTVNTDETWIFVRGGFGEFRLGDEDGPVDNSAVGGFTVAAGTGGIDGSVVDAIGTGVVKPFNSGDATKIRYYTPSIGGFQLGVSYTPNVDAGGNSLAFADVEVQHFVEGAVTYTGNFAGFDILASGVGSWCDLNVAGEDDCYTWGAGASVNLFGFRLAGGYFSQTVGDAEKDFFNAGIGAGLGPVNLSLTYGQVIDSSDLVVNGNELDEPYNLVLSADVALAPGLVLAGDVSYFDNDVDSGPFDGDDDGWQAVARLGLAF